MVSISPIYGKLGDCLLLFYPHYSYYKRVYIYMHIIGYFIFLIHLVTHISKQPSCKQ
jgi:hypothetical protein